MEGGVKTTWASGRASANLAVYLIDWTDLQLNTPNPLVPGQFYVANVGGARSAGVEIELNARPHPVVDLFASVGTTHAEFSEGSVSGGFPVSGKRVPGTPEYTASLGAQLARAVGAATFYGRGEAVFYGAFKYDDLNLGGQDAYSLTNVRAGVRGRRLFGEAWAKNVFDARYVPIAFPAFGGLAPSGFIGELGRPRTFGVSGGIAF